MDTFLLPLTLLVSTLALVAASDITSVLNNSNCKTFSSLINSTGVIQSYNSTAEKGITLFAPSDDAFKEQGLPDLSKLNHVELVSLLLYHAIPTYAPKGTLKNLTKDPIRTLASDSIRKFYLTVKIDGSGNVTVETGVNSGKVVATALDEAPVSVFVLDRILLPVEFYGNATVSPPPGPADAPKSRPPAPKKSGASCKVESAGVIKAVLVTISVMVFFF